MGKNETLFRISLYSGCIVLVIILNLVYFKMAKNIIEESLKGRLNNKMTTNNVGANGGTIKALEIPSTSSSQIFKAQSHESLKSLSAADTKLLVDMLNADLAGKTVEIEEIDVPNSDVNGDLSKRKEVNLTKVIEDYYNNKMDEYAKAINKTFHDKLHEFNKTVGWILPPVDFQKAFLM